MKQGEIWLVDFAPRVGDEIDKKRPAVIVSSNLVGKLKLKIVVPVTDPATHRLAWHVPLAPNKTTGLVKTSVADCFQIKSISQNRFLKRIGILEAGDLDEIKVTLAKVLDIL